ncbi:pfs domain-containing protein [Penicillium verhagenii]|nr:pfs domain-containing protein [Penicillium verhagenii]
MSALGHVLLNQGETAAAFDLYTERLTAHLKTLGPTHHKTAACYNGIAWFLHNQSEDKMVISTHKEAQETIKQKLQGQNISFFRSCLTMASSKMGVGSRPRLSSSDVS